MKGEPEVFIIESLNFDDEDNERFEGRIISQILAMSGKHCEYYYIRTERELTEILKRFAVSEYRYLHLSCHGSADSMHTTLDDIPFRELGILLRPYLRERRLFISACSMVNDALARELMTDSGCYSILGPDEDVRFGDAAVLWAAFYHAMFTNDSTAMRRADLKFKALELADLFRVPLNIFTSSELSAHGYRLDKLHPQVRPENKLHRRTSKQGPRR
jgi:hypothetical protein